MMPLLGAPLVCSSVQMGLTSNTLIADSNFVLKRRSFGLLVPSTDLLTFHQEPVRSFGVMY